jgi:hypothetical protein
METEQRALLEAFVVENDDLEQLESLLAQFNIFEAIGAVRQELRHSDFLGFLLDPAQNHGLDDLFLKRLLMRVLSGTPDAPLSPVEIDVADLHEAVVWREWRNIDLLIHDPGERLVCAIENKVGTTEHSNQLQRYRQIVEGEFPGCRHVFIYLTPEGEVPSDDAYIPLDYGQVAELLDAIRKSRQSVLGADVSTLMAHYTTMLGRHIVSESEISQLCQRIYRQHKQALDLIYEYRPDLQSDLAELAKELVAQAAPHDLVEDSAGKSYIRFALAQWDTIPAFLTSQGWTSTNRILAFEFTNAVDRLQLGLIIGPGPAPIRQAIFDLTQRHPQVFRGGRRRLATKWTTAYVRRFLNRRDYEDADFEQLAEKVRGQWAQFLERDLPEIRRVIAEANWPEVGAPGVGRGAAG